jgi:hypothetical protein
LWQYVSRNKEQNNPAPQSQGSLHNIRENLIVISLTALSSLIPTKIGYLHVHADLLVLPVHFKTNSATLTPRS